MASDTALDAVQTAVYARLNGDTVLQGKVWDYAPQPPVFPYLTIGDDHEVDYSTFGKTGRNVDVMIHIWSRSTGGWKEANQLLSAVVRLLDYPSTPLPISGWPTTSISLYGDILKLRDPDGITRHVVAKFRIYTEQ